MVYHGAVLAEGGDPSNTLIPVVGECDDLTADARTVTTEDVDRARAALSTDVPEGSVGGTGMTCFDFAGGIGTASADRRAHAGRAADVQLRRARAPDRRRPALRPGRAVAAGGLLHRRLRMRRAHDGAAAAAAGVAAAAGPGTCRLLRTTARRDRGRLHHGTRADARELAAQPFFAAAYEAAEEAVYNCLVAERPPMRKRDGREHRSSRGTCCHLLLRRRIMSGMEDQR
jgi:L-aminopeptidase/D-esterase-like protein